MKMIKLNGIDLNNGERITFKEILREFTYKLNTDVICNEIEEGIDKIELRGNKKEDYFFILTAIPKQKVEKFLDDKIHEKEIREQRNKEKEQRKKEYIKKLRDKLENGVDVELTLIWFADNVAYEIWNKNDKGEYNVKKRDTEGEFEDDWYETWSIDSILEEVETRGIPEEIT